MNRLDATKWSETRDKTPRTETFWVETGDAEAQDRDKIKTLITVWDETDTRPRHQYISRPSRDRDVATETHPWTHFNLEHKQAQVYIHLLF